MALNLNNLINDYDGAIFLQPGASEWGYIERQWFLQIPLAQDSWPQVNIGNTLFTSNEARIRFLKANYRKLAAADALNSPDKALFGTLLRYHLYDNGCVDADLIRRGVIENEYEVATHAGDNWDAAANNIPEIAHSTEIAAYVKRYADTFVHMLVYVFSSRGHHWQDEYDAVYERLMRANNIPKPTNFVMPTYKELFRNILHCFGIRLLLEFTLWCKENNRMSNPMRLRFSPHAPVAGSAIITTSYAVIQEMKTEGWYDAFKERYHEQVQAITREVDQISQNPYEYHVASRVISGAPKRDVSNDAMRAFKDLSQIMLGYIEYLGNRHSLSGQKVITSKAGGKKSIADQYAAVFHRFARMEISADKPKELFAIASAPPTAPDSASASDDD